MAGVPIQTAVPALIFSVSGSSWALVLMIVAVLTEVPFCPAVSTSVFSRLIVMGKYPAEPLPHVGDFNLSENFRNLR
jgi:hypothetical protein